MAARVPFKDMSIREYEDLLRDLSRMNGNLANSNQQSSSTKTSNTVNSPGNSRELKKSMGEVQKALKNAVYNLSVTAKSDVNYAKAVSKYAKAMNDAKNSLDVVIETNDLQAKTVGNLVEEYKIMAKNTRDFSSSLAAAQKNSSILSASLIGRHREIDRDTQTYKNFTTKLSDSVSSLGKTFLVQNDLWDDVSKSIKQNLSPEEFARIRQKLGNAQSAFTENLAKVGITDLSELAKNDAALQKRLNAPASEGNKSGEELRGVLLTIAHQMKLAGHNVKTDLTANNVDYAELAKEVAALNTSVNKTVNGMNAAGLQANTLVGKFLLGAKGLAGIKDKFILPLMESGAIISNFKSGLDNAKKGFKEIQDFNVAHIADSFKSVQVESVKMGMSFEETTKYLSQENVKRQEALLGAAKFNKLNDSFRKTFNDMGYTMKQGAEVVGPTLEAALATGIDMKNTAALNSAVKDTMDSFQKVAGFVNVSAAEYAKLNAELVKSEDVSNVMLGLSNDQAQAYAKNLQSQRDEMALRGISIQQAQEMVKLQEAAKREKVQSRVKGAAMMAMRAQMSGMSAEDANRAMQISMQGKSASAENSKWLTETFMPQLAKADAERQNQFAGSENMAGQMITDRLTEHFDEGMAGSQNALMKGAGNLAQAQKSNAAATPAEAKAAEDASKANVAVGQLGQVADQASSFLNNTFVQALKGVALGFGGLMLQTLSLTAQFGGLKALMGAGGAGDVLGKGGGLLGKAGGLLGKVGGAAGGLASGAGGMLSTAAGALGPAALVAGAGAAGYGAGMLINKGVDYATGGKKSIGTMIYDTANNDSAKLASSDANAEIEMGKQRIAQGLPVSPALAAKLKAAGINVPAPAAPVNAAPPSPVGAPTAASASAQPATSTSGTSVNTTSTATPVTPTSSIVNSADAVSQQKLGNIVENTALMAKLLQQIIDSGSPGTKTAMTPIPSQKAYLTGRG